MCIYIYIYRLSWVYGRYTVAGSCMLMRFIKQLLTGGHHPVPLPQHICTNPPVHHHPTHSWQKKSAGEKKCWRNCSPKHSTPRNSRKCSAVD